MAASGLLARRQHLVACIRPRERVDVPFSWHTVRVRVPLPVNLLRATRTFFHLAIFTRLTRFLPVVYTSVCIVVSDVNRCLASTHTNRASIVKDKSNGYRPSFVVDSTVTLCARTTTIVILYELYLAKYLPVGRRISSVQHAVA